MHRGPVEQLIGLLEAIHKFPNYPRYRVSSIAGLRLNKGYELLEKLEKAGLVSYNTVGNGERVVLSADGMTWLHSMKLLLNRINNGYALEL